MTLPHKAHYLTMLLLAHPKAPSTLRFAGAVQNLANETPVGTRRIGAF